MNLILSILAGIAVLVILILIIAAFTKKSYSVLSEITIIQPKQLVFEYLKQLRNQDNFSKWALMDPNMKKEFRGVDGKVGFISAWESEKKNVGKGEQEIIKITEGEQIDFEIRFIKPFPGVAKAFLSTQSLSEKETRVKWGFSSKMKYPMNFMLLFMNMDKMIGNDLSTGLSNLKSILEK
jgi:hypothetical protein